MDLALKSTQVADFCDKSSRFAEFKNKMAYGSAVNFGADSGLCLSRCSNLRS